MKPISLKFCGINSYETEFFIDFENLAKDGIFGIFGPTGSGKSTILDAITLALYGKIPRYNKTTPSDSMNVASNIAEVELSFDAVQENGKIARFEIHRVYKRNNKDGVNVSKCLFRLADGNIIADRKEREVNAAIISTIGLSYDDFTRSVVLPQGKFSEFMFLDSKDRSKMLERLFDLEKFGESLKSRINAFESRAKSDVDAYELKISFYGDISDELLAKKQHELNKISEEIGQLTKERELFFKQREEYKALETAYIQYLAASQGQEILLRQAQDIEDAKEALSDAIKAEALLVPIDNWKATTKQLEQASKSLAFTQELSKATGTQAEICEADYKKARKAKEDNLPILLKAEQELNSHLERFGEVAALEIELSTLREKWKTEEANLKSLKRNEESGSSSISELKTKLNDIVDKKLELAIEPEMLQSLIEASGIEKELNKMNQELDDKKKELSDYNANIAQQIQLLADLENELSKALAKHHVNLALQLSQNLANGIPCPVCGSIHHPHPASYNDSNANDMDLSKLQDRVRNAKTKLNHTQALLDGTKNNIKELSHEIDSLMKSLEGYTKLPLTDSFALALEMAFEKSKAHAALEKQETALRADVEIASQAQASLELAISRLEAEQEITYNAGLEKAAAIKTKKMALGNFGDLTSVQTELQNIEKQKNALAISEKESEDLKNKYQSELLKVERNLASLTERVAGLENTRQSQQQFIDKGLASSGFNNLEAIERAILPHEQRAALEIDIKNYEDKKTELTGLLTNSGNVLKNINDPTSIPEISNAMQEKFALADAELMSKRELSAILSQEITKISTDLVVVKGLIEQKKLLIARHTALNEIVSLFRGNAFIKFLAARHLHYITNEATIRLARMTGGRYAIEYDEDTNFIIRDDFNGGSRRPPASLSGGETFMASLCLALALSAKIQMKSYTDLSFFFLDEGFGSLDRDSLNTVVDALEALREENMVVGVISHVEEMKERIKNKLEL
ncbi:MAG: SMC family ATPase [Defluviitaleaceae bacterium]|nr:SMC family ATPase [Defluviitaleaceae bacterium]